MAKTIKNLEQITGKENPITYKIRNMLLVNYLTVCPHAPVQLLPVKTDSRLATSSTKSVKEEAKHGYSYIMAVPFN
jgi:hypothetical protein